MPRKSAKLLKASTLDLCHSLDAVLNSLKRPEEREVLEEATQRLRDYSQLNTGGIPARDDKAETVHKKHLAELKTATTFFCAISKSLEANNLIDWQQPLDGAGVRLSEQVRKMREKPVHLTALIREIYARGNVKYNYLALPDELRESVAQVLKATGQIS